MDEGDKALANADSRLGVDQLDALIAELGERRLDVSDRVGDVVQPRPLFGDELADRRIGTERLEQLSHEQATAERAGTRSLLDADNTYYGSAEAANFVVYRDDEPVGRVSAFHNHALVCAHGPCGLVGLFACENDAETASALMRAAAGWLAERGCKAMRGPMAGDIWHRWRFMTRGFDSTPFPGEPASPSTTPASSSRPASPARSSRW